MDIDWWQWWHWAVLGLVLIAAELAVPAFVLVWFGLGALFTGLALFIVPSLSQATQIMLWTLSSIAMMVLWFKLFKKSFYKTRVGMSDSNIIGEVGLLIRDVEPFKKGQVRFQKPLMGSDVWDCISDETIQRSERVKVLSVEGNFLKIGSINGINIGEKSA